MECTSIWNSLKYLLVTLKPFGFPFTYDPTTKTIRGRSHKQKLIFLAYFLGVVLFAVTTIVFNFYRAKYIPGVSSRAKRASYFIAIFLSAVTIQICLFSNNLFLSNQPTYHMINVVFTYFGIISGN